MKSQAQDNPTSEGQPAKRFELKLVYRTLRLISDWALVYFYSDVYVEGIENVDPEGALILSVQTSG